MAAPFAAQEARDTAAVFTRLANADATAFNTHGEPLTFTVLFDAASASLMGGMVGDVAPQAQCKTSDVAGVQWQSGITVNATDYTVANISHDGAGVTTLTLREA